MPAVLLLFALKPTNVGSGAVLTLVLPLGITLVVLAAWWFLAARSRARPRPVDVTVPEADHPPSTPR
jgi:hypothetical protein